jgi:cell wall-associated NlpC family hydrolase
MTQPRTDRGSISLAAAAGAALALLLPVLLIGAVLGGFPAGQAAACQAQPSPASLAGDTIPANYLALYLQAGQEYGIPWEVLAGIGEVESDQGRSGLSGVHSGSNAYGAAGPMQFGIGGAAGNTWGGAPIHPASEKPGGYGIDGDHDGRVDVYDPGDAIPSAAGFLVAHGAPAGMQAALLAYNHSAGYVSLVLRWAASYASGGTQAVTAADSTSCAEAGAGPLPAGAAGKIIGYAEQQLGKPYVFSGGPGGEITLNPRVCPAQKADVSDSSGATGVVQATLDLQQRCVAAAVILYAAEQLGKPYQWGGTGPDAFDCSGLAMMAYRSAGLAIPRTSQEQWAAGPRVPAGQEQPGDLVFFAGSDGTPEAPGHVGIVIGGGEMIEAYASGFPVRVSAYGQLSSPPGDQVVVGFTRPDWD